MWSLAQGIRGRVIDNEGNPIIGATVQDLKTGSGVITDTKGFFILSNSTSEKIQLKVGSVGYTTLTDWFDLAEGVSIAITLEENTLELNDVVITADTEVALKKTLGFNVEAISVELLQDVNLDINQILSMSNGIMVRESGGLGSNFDLSLNGLSGKQIRYFMDGVPMENFGSSLTLNNFPSNLIRNIEVYKGVAPIELSSDALGGVINIKTPNLNEQFIDASYSVGSFNTHRASLFGQYSTSKGLFARISSFYNYSDNNYWMDGTPVVDEFGNVTGGQKERRFHDSYSSSYLSGRIGLTNKKLADEISINIIHANNLKEYQHPDVSVNRVFGGYHTKGNSNVGSVNFRKKHNKINIQLNALYGLSRSTVYDTLNKRYSWNGQYQELESNSGELFNQKSIFNVEDKFSNGLGVLKYQINEEHQIVTAANYKVLNRKGSDDINPNNIAFTAPNYLNKSIVSFSYDYQSSNKDFGSSLFAKKYWLSAEINAEDFLGSGELKTTRAKSSYQGYGVAFSYLLSKKLRGKLSFEKAYRLPEPDEIMGNGQFGLPNPDLRPENSNNINTGIVFTNNARSSSVNSELNIFYRPVKDFIAFINDQGVYGKNYNVGNVQILGFETSTIYKLNRNYVVNVNLTYQDLRDQTPRVEGLENSNYGNRLPNIPYFFWNLGFAYNYFLNDNKVTVSWNTRYVHEFFLYWENLGYKGSKNRIPTQFTHGINISYSFSEGKYSLSAAVANIMNAQVYDNFNIQKPGRSFSIKARYYLNI